MTAKQTTRNLLTQEPGLGKSHVQTVSTQNIDQGLAQRHDRLNPRETSEREACPETSDRTTSPPVRADRNAVQHHSTLDLWEGRDKNDTVSKSASNRSIGAPESGQETADGYGRIVCHLADRWRVVTCKDNWQWIIQRRKAGDAGRNWRAVSYHRTQNALIRRCASLCGQMDPCAMAALAALPEYFGGLL